MQAAGESLGDVRDRVSSMTAALGRSGSGDAACPRAARASGGAGCAGRTAGTSGGCSTDRAGAGRGGRRFTGAPRKPTTSGRFRPDPGAGQAEA